MAGTAEKYLKPEVIRQVARLDLRAKFIVEGFIAGLHASPFQGFSVEFSEHRKYTAGDNISDIDWNVYAKTDRFYIKKFQAETNLTGYLVMDLSGSMGYTYRQELTKFEYGISLAAALGYLMIHQQDPVGLIAFDQKVRQSLAPASKRSQLGNILSLLAKLQAGGRDRHRRQPAPGRQHDPPSQPGHDLQRPAGRPRADPAGAPPAAVRGPRRDRLPHPRRGRGRSSRSRGCSSSRTTRPREILEVDADAIKADYLEEVASFQAGYKQRVRPRPDRLRPAAHRDAVRQGPDELPARAGRPARVSAHHGNLA